MHSIEYQTKKLLKSKDLQNPSSFEELGYIYFGPMIFNFFAWLVKETEGSDKILFNSREGYFLQKIYKVFQKKYNLPLSVYFKTSRKLSSMAALFTKDDIYETFTRHRYSGYLSTLLKDRFGITPIIHFDYLVDTKVDIPNIDIYINDILHKSVMVREEYRKYIYDEIGISENSLMIDSGHQATTQQNIQKAYGLNFRGRYIICNNTHLTDVAGFCDFDTTRFRQNIIFFESVFTDKVGSYIDIINGQFINEPIDTTKQFFKEKEQIVLGIQNFIKDMFTLQPNINSTSFEYPDYIFNLMCKKDFIKNKALMDIFYHDNYYTRMDIKKVIQYEN